MWIVSTPMVSHMTRIGEKPVTWKACFTRLADYYDEEVEAGYPDSYGSY